MKIGSGFAIVAECTLGLAIDRALTPSLHPGFQEFALFDGSVMG